MALRSQTQRSLLLGFIVSIACCGLVGVYCLLLGRLGELEGRILLTTTAVGAASILGLASAIPWERRRWPPIGLIGFVAVSVALALVLVAIWGDIPWQREVFYKGMSIACVGAVAFPQVGLLSLARLRRAYLWVQGGTVVVVALLALQIGASIIAETSDDFWYRIMGILAIVVVCGTIAVPVLHRVSVIRLREEIETVDLKLELTCPRCKRRQELPVGRSCCSGCGLKLQIEIEENRCTQCGYSLYRLTSPVCPECGVPIAEHYDARTDVERLSRAPDRTPRGEV